MGPGIVQPDGSLMTGAAITKTIELLNAEGRRRSVAAILGDRWEYSRRQRSLIPVLMLPAVGSVRSLDAVPEVCVIRPGDPEWVDLPAKMAVPATPPAKMATQPTTDKAEVASRQSARKSRTPPKRKRT